MEIAYLKLSRKKSSETSFFKTEQKKILLNNLKNIYFTKTEMNLAGNYFLIMSTNDVIKTSLKRH